MTDERRPTSPGRRTLAIVSALLVAGLLATLAAVALARASEGEPVRSARGFSGPPSGSSATIWAVGDAAAPTEAAEEVARLVNAKPLDRFLYLGDVYEDGTRDEFDRHYAPLYGDIRDRTLPTPGNHDAESFDEGYAPFWSQVSDGPVPAHYAEQVAGWKIVSVNSEGGVDADDAQVRWLEEQMAGPGKCRLAFWHTPRYSAGKHGDSANVEALWSAVEGRATLLVNAHDHNMQRMRPREGTLALIAGSGGNGLYPVRDDDPRLAWGDDRHYGALRLRLEPGRADWSFVSAAGDELDSGTVRCDPE